MSLGGKDHTGHKRFAPGARKRVHFSDPDTDTLARLGLRAGHGGLGDKSNGRAASGSSPSIALTLVAGNAQIQGVVKWAGEGVTGVMVVLVPKDPARHRDLFGRDQSDLDGTFSLPGVVPGS